jgi:hypothetical protein
MEEHAGLLKMRFVEALKAVADTVPVVPSDRASTLYCYRFSGAGVNPLLRDLLDLDERQFRFYW